MARYVKCFIILLVCCAHSYEARKVLLNNMEKEKTDPDHPSQEANLLLNALPQGNVLPSKFPRNGFFNKKNQYVRGHVDRNLGSVPSPGIGH
ncbi:hypothetical protein A4A49_20170 [Nicotiana attenuata]|uniref:Uncharacterized protein n=1 Tax=Nicotiana attenuata TaxID=49451 RepID=A0A1J6L2Y7_NICAT|nr:hypothetical protein A4A49_20170 [Nicotiana attenuata]